MNRKQVQKYILIIMFEILLIFMFKIICSEKQQITNYSIKYKEYNMGQGTTTYKDFSKLQTLDTAYSYSSIRRSKDTKYIILNNPKNKKEFTRANDGFELESLNEKTGFSIAMYKSDSIAKVLIENCATDANGNSLDVVITLSDFKSFFDKNNNTQYNGNDICIRLRNTGFQEETNQARPVASDGNGTFEDSATERGCTQVSHSIGIGSPINFNLYTHGAQVKCGIKYYKHTDHGNPNLKATYKYNESKFESTTVSKVNGYFFDLDVGKDVNKLSNSEKENLNKENITIFKEKILNEGINPVLANGETATIYYNKNKTAKYYLNSVDDDKYGTIKLAEDNGGIRIDKCESYGITNPKTGKPTDINVGSAWYGQAAFMTNTIKNSTLNFVYGGINCGINYLFASPVPYTTPTPTKTVDKTKITKGESVTYTINQYIPNTYSTDMLRFYQVYTSNNAFRESNKISKLKFEDTINSNLEITQVKMFNETENVTSKFNIVNNNNKVTATLKNEEFEKIESYSCNFKMKIIARLKNSGVNASTIKNKATVTLQISNIGNGKNTNEVSTDVYYKIRGNVWVENPADTNPTNVDGKRQTNETRFKGIEIRLYKKENGKFKIIKYKRADSNGNYDFGEVAGDEVYKLEYWYNGQLFQSTYYKKNYTDGTYSNAKEDETERNNLNNKFVTINSYPNNYGTNKRTYGTNQIIKDIENGNVCTAKKDGAALTYTNIISIYNNINNSTYESYNNNFYNELIKQVKEKYNITDNTINDVINYIKDCMIKATTDEISINSITNGNNDTINYGVYLRPTCDLAIKNDIYRVSYTINGKSFSHIYNQKVNIKKVEDRANNNYYNGNNKYALGISLADYMYNASDYGLSNNRNLTVYVTYKITLYNQGQSYAKVNSINNWYDDETYEYTGSVCTAGTFNGYIDNNGTPHKTEVIISNTNETINKGNSKYKKINISGKNGSFKIYRNGIEDDILNPGEETEIYITYKVKKENINGKERTKIEEGQTKQNNDDLIGKKCIVEISQYQTPYKVGGTLVIPDSLNNNDQKNNKTITNGIQEGTIDTNSNPGNLSEGDLTDNEELDYSSNRIENDTDKSPNLKIKLTLNNKISGKVFEDLRNVTTNNFATIGNGVYDTNEPLINGVTIELVEIIRDVDENGIGKDNYIGEKIWNTQYYSGIGKSMVIIKGEANLQEQEKTLAKGEYMFESIPTGDFYVRFKYGDTERTVLKSGENSVNTLIGMSGMNEKSYNGQDYKSTIYQSKSSKETYSYNGIIDQYNDNFYNNKNYINNETDFNNYNNNKSNYLSNIKGKAYLYNLNNIDNTDSDAKDLYYYRERTNAYSTEIKNDKAMILTSFENSILSNSSNQEKTDKQKELINELIKNTSMIAQTGIINIGEIDEEKTKNVNLGLVERPKAQIILNEEIINIKLTLENGKVLFDTNKSVSNAYFQQHKEHTYSYINNLLNRLTVTDGNSKEKPELIQMYIDDELLAGATFTATYRLTIKNVGEVDYVDKKFYYSGQENNPDANISTIKIDETVSYVPNNINFRIENTQNNDNKWKLTTSKELLDNNKIDEYYKKILETYNTLIVTDKDNTKELKPVISVSNKENSEIQIQLQLDTVVTTSLLKASNLVYNNLSEITTLTSKNGRKMAYSIPGNQEMADQSLGMNAPATANTNVDVVTPNEVDSDSAQKVNVLPPTGKKTDNRLLIIAILMGIVIFEAGVILIRQVVLNRNKKY